MPIGRSEGKGQRMIKNLQKIKCPENGGKKEAKKHECNGRTALIEIR